MVKISRYLGYENFFYQDIVMGPIIFKGHFGLSDIRSEKTTTLYLLYNEKDLEYCKHQTSHTHTYTIQRKRFRFLFNWDQSTESTGYIGSESGHILGQLDVNLGMLHLFIIPHVQTQSNRACSSLLILL
jgi:hypothetical protein